MTPDSVYADGGVVLVNPSPHAGMWAWCHVRTGRLVRGEGSKLVLSPDELVAEGSGVVLPADCGTPEVSNNQTEYLALLHCLEALPDGWSGLVYTDSGVTLLRFRDYGAAKERGLRSEWVERAGRVLKRLGHLEFVLLGGHPSKKELAAGRRKDGKPVSPWNVRCDKRCRELSAAFQQGTETHLRG